MTSKVTKVTVFLEGAEITRTLEAGLHPGKNEIIVTGLPDELSGDSVTAEIDGEARLLSVSSHVRPQTPPEADETVLKLQKELRECEDQLTDVLAKQEVLGDEYSFLQENRKIGGTEGSCLEELQRRAEYYHKKYNEIALERLSAQREQRELEAKKKQLMARLGAYDPMDGRPSVDIAVELSAEKECSIKLELSYFVTCAGWRPVYEIRVRDLEHPVRLISRGQIYQNTGEDWKEVSLTLSTGSPSSHGEPPELRPWYLDVERPSAPSACWENEYSEAAVMESELEASVKCFAGPAVYAETRQSCSSVEFVLPEPVSVAALEDGQRVDITQYELEAAYQHFCIPKLDTSVYLLAKIEGWESLDLLEAEAGIFLGNTYLGNAHIDPTMADDLMRLSLGRDHSVIVTREKGKDFTGRTLMGLNKKVSREWHITVRNTRHTPISIQLQDQLPVPITKSITVEPVELSGASYDTETGKLCWDLNLKPGDSVQLKVKYSVMYPKKDYIVIE